MKKKEKKNLQNLSSNRVQVPKFKQRSIFIPIFHFSNLCPKLWQIRDHGCYKTYRISRLFFKIINWHKHNNVEDILFCCKTSHHAFIEIFYWGGLNFLKYFLFKFRIFPICFFKSTFLIISIIESSIKNIYKTWHDQS